MSIDKLILKLLNKSNSLEELEILESWKRESEQNIAFLNLMDTNTGDKEYTQFDTQKAWDSIEQQLDGKVVTARFSWLKYAAVVMFMISAGFFVFNPADNNALPIYTAELEIQNLELTDGSLISLNKNSTLEQLSDFSGVRELNLQGEAYFDVAHDPESPFTVNVADEGFVKVIGTSFNIINTSDEFDLRVYSGKVELHILDRIIELEKGDRVSRQSGAYVRLKHHDKNYLSWKTDELIFESDPLEKVFSCLSRHYDVEFTFAQDVKLNGCELRSRYSDQSIQDILKEFEKLYSLKYIIKDSEILIEELNCF